MASNESVYQGENSSSYVSIEILFIITQFPESPIELLFKICVNCIMSFQQFNCRKEMHQMFYEQLFVTGFLYVHSFLLLSFISCSQLVRVTISSVQLGGCAAKTPGMDCLSANAHLVLRQWARLAGIALKMAKCHLIDLFRFIQYFALHYQNPKIQEDN